MSKYTIRPFQAKDAESICNLIHETLFIINTADYPRSLLEQLSKYYNPNTILKIAKTGHMYVACEEAVIVGCGAVLPDLDQSVKLATIFVLPKCHGLGLGTQILETLENDSLCKQAKTATVASSITACGFYLSKGYMYKDGKKSLTDDYLYLLEKTI